MVKVPTYSGVLPFTVSAAIPRNFPIGTQREMHFVPRIAAQSAHVFSDPTFFPRRWSEKCNVALETDTLPQHFEAVREGIALRKGAARERTHCLSF